MSFVEFYIMLLERRQKYQIVLSNVKVITYGVFLNTKVIQNNQRNKVELNKKNNEKLIFRRSCN